MWYLSELNFVHHILQKMHLQIIQLVTDKPPAAPPDFGLRSFLGHEAEYQRFFCEQPFQVPQNTIYKLTDPYLCNYLFLLLPDKSATVLMIGPYMSMKLTTEQLLQEAEFLSVPPSRFKEMEYYYSNIPVLTDESFFFSVVNSFADVLWGNEAYSIEDGKEELPISFPSSSKEDLLTEENTLLSMQAMEQRYAYENEILTAVSHGMTHKSELMLSHLSQMSLEQRVADPVRNIKNYSIIMNTLMRKAAERGCVHPLYLNRVSSDFARKIELVSSTSGGYKLMAEMNVTYCRLVKNHSMSAYSLPIRKTLVCIEADLSRDLSLHTLAAIQNISCGHLSALFTKEVGRTLTDYVNKRRMKHAAELLRTTVLQIQTIAQYCGIGDVNYFSKTFKRYYKITPTQFRSSQQPHPDSMK